MRQSCKNEAAKKGLQCTVFWNITYSETTPRSHRRGPGSASDGKGGHREGFP